MKSSNSKFETKRALVENLIGESLLDFAARHHYCEEFFKLFSGLPQQYSKRKVAEHIKSKADMRSIEDYHREIGLGWVIEDYLIDVSGGKLNRYGCDKDRTFLTSMDPAQISNVGDLVDESGKIFEVIADYHCVIQNEGHMNLRHEKLPHLRKQNAYIIMVDVVNKTVFCKNAKDFPFFKINNFAPFGGKPVYRIYLNDDVQKFKQIERVS